MEHKYKDTSVYYEILGQGNALLVFLHGWGASGELMMPLQKKIDFFDNDFTYLIIDFPPFGKSSEPTSPWILDDYVNLTREIILSNFNELSNISVIGHSFGGRVALKLAGDADLKIDKLILFAPAGIKPRFSLNKKIKIWEYKFYKKINSKKALKFGSDDYRILSPVMKRTFNNIIKEDLTKICEKIMVNTLIFFGDKDKETPLYMGKKLNRKIKKSRLVVIKNGDHFAYLYHLNSIFPIVHSFLFNDKKTL